MERISEMGSCQEERCTKGPTDKPGDTYYSSFLMVYLFNNIVASGPLILPKAISNAGVILGPLVLLLVAGMSFVTATFVVEAMATANAYAKFRSRKDSKATLLLECPSSSSSDVEEEINSTVEKEGGMSKMQEESLPLIHTPVVTDSQEEETDGSEFKSYSSTDVLLPEDYEITEKFEMGGMANLFFHPVGITSYYIIICLYLYGGQIFLLETIALCLVAVTCYRTDALELCNGNTSENLTESDITYFNTPGQFSPNAVCFGDVTQLQTYYIYLSIIALLICSWVYFNFTTSKYLQLATTILRSIAIGLMISIAIARLAQGQRTNYPPPLARLSGFAIIFGVSNFISKCQHILPGMVIPMKSKKRVLVMILISFATAQALYFVLYFTAIFSVPQHKLLDLYTLNFFKPFRSNDSIGGHILSVIGYFLALFPVFSLGTVYPIISITLRENIKELARIICKHCIGDKPLPFVINHLLFPTLAVFPALAIAFATTKVVLVASMSGSLLGVWLQYLFPAMFVLTGKYVIEKKLKKEYKNKYASPFSHIVILVFVIVWAVGSFLLSVIEFVLKIVQHTFL